jgi:hypothetical protein
MKSDQLAREAFARMSEGVDCRLPRPDEVERALEAIDAELSSMASVRDGGRKDFAAGLRWVFAIGLCCAGIGAGMLAGAPRPLAELLAARIGNTAEESFKAFMVRASESLVSYK